MTPQTIGERIKQALYEKHMPALDLARSAEISEGGLSQIINGKVKNLKVDTAMRIARALNISPIWLITGDDSGMPVASLEGSDRDGEFYHIPRFEVSFDPVHDSEPKFTEFKYDRITTFHRTYFEKYGIATPKYCRSFKVQGDSMQPLIRSGDYVVVDCTPNQRIADGDIYAFCDNKGLRVKRLIAPLRGGLIIRSDNKLYDDEYLSPDEVRQLRIIGHVIDRSGSLMGA